MGVAEVLQRAARGGDKSYWVAVGQSPQKTEETGAEAGIAGHGFKFVKEAD